MTYFEIVKAVNETFPFPEDFDYRAIPIYEMKRRVSDLLEKVGIDNPIADGEYRELLAVIQENQKKIYVNQNPRLREELSKALKGQKAEREIPKQNDFNNKQRILQMKAKTLAYIIKKLGFEDKLIGKNTAYSDDMGTDEEMRSASYLENILEYIEKLVSSSDVLEGFEALTRGKTLYDQQLFAIDLFLQYGLNVNQEIFETVTNAMDKILSSNNFFPGGRMREEDYGKVDSLILSMATIIQQAVEIGLVRRRDSKVYNFEDKNYGELPKM